MPPFKIRLLGISYDSAADIDSTRLSFEPGNILSPHISVKDIFELETGLKIDQGVSWGMKANLLAQKYGAGWMVGVKVPTDSRGKATGAKLIADANAGWEGKRLYLGQFEVAAHDGMNAAIGYRMDTGKHFGGGSSLKAFLESAKEALGEPAVEALIKALKPALDNAKLSKLGSLAVSEESHIALGSRTVLSVKPKEFFGEKIDNRELPGDPEGYYTFSIEPKIEGLGVFVGRRHGKDNRARIVLDGVTEEGTTFVVTAFVEAPKDKADEYFKSINENLIW